MKTTMKTLTSLLICCLFAASYVNAHTLNRPESTNYINGVTALNEGNPEKAYELLNAEINEYPQNGYAHCYMALICNYYGDMKMALDAVNNALELLPQEDNEYRSFAYYTRGTMLLNLKEWDLAATDLTEAIRLNPEDTEKALAPVIDSQFIEMLQQALSTQGNFDIQFEEKAFQEKKAFLYSIKSPELPIPINMRIVQESDTMISFCIAVNCELPEESPFPAEPQPVNPLMETTNTVFGIAVLPSALCKQIMD